MFLNLLKIAWRNLWKHKYYTFLNLFGLTLSMACTIILFLFIRFHLSIDTYHHNAKHIYRVVNSVTFDDGVPLYDQGAPIALARDLKAGDPGVKEVGILLRIHDINLTIPQSALSPRKIFAEHENIAITNGDFFKLFDYDWEQGTPNSALTEPNTVVLSHSLADKYFGTQAVIGKTIIVDNKNTFRITGIVKDHRANTDIKSDIFLSLSTLENIYPGEGNKMIHDWWYINSTNSIYVELKNGVNPKHIESDISKMQMKIKDFAKFYHFFMLPLSEVHFDGRFAGLIQKSLLIALGAVGLLLILISCINFINIALAQSLKRAKEIGTRKVLGGTPFLIFLQFITETALITLFAAFFSFAAVLLCLPILNTWLGTQLIFNFISDYPLIVFVFFLLLLVILAAGIYPGLILSRFKPILAIKNQIGNQTPNSGFTQKGLIILQNTLAQIMIISTLLISLQVKYLKTADLGFNKSAILMLPIPDYAKNKTNYLRNLLLANPNIKNVSFCYQAPISTADKSGSIKIEGRDWEKFVGYTMFGDANYIKTFGIQLIAGRNLIESDTSKEFLLNELLVKKLGFKDPKNILGRRFIAGDASDRSGVIVGVVKDFHSKSLYSAIRPEYITTARDWYKNLGIKIGSINHLDLMNIIQKDWKSVYPDHVFEYRFLDEQIADYYNNEDLLNKLISSSAILAIFISCLGLTGLISLLIVHRTKEIGIRKVLGASISSISLLLSRDTLKWVLVAGVIASPLAWIIMSQYLQNFAYRIQIPGWVFVLTGIVALLIAFLTISFQSIKAAKANPIISLRSGE